MLIQTLLNQEMNEYEKIAHVLFDLGYATRQQLCDIMKWSPKQCDNFIRKFRDTYETKDEKWIEHFDLRVKSKKGGRPVRAYRLSEHAINELKQLRGIDTRMKWAKPYQVYHYLGITNIIARLLQRINRSYLEHIDWLSEYETWGNVIDAFMIKAKSAFGDQRIPAHLIVNTIKPDASLRIGSQWFWIEFDNATENQRQLKKRYDRYMKTIRPNINGNKLYIEKIDLPIVWVTTSDRRRENMKHWYEEIKKKWEREGRTLFPKMFFVVEGQETQFFIDYVQGKITLQASAARKD